MRFWSRKGSPVLPFFGLLLRKMNRMEAFG